MKVMLFASAIVAAVALGAGQPSTPAIDNERVTVWDLTKAGSRALTPTRPFVSISLTPRVAFAEAGHAAPAGSIVIELKDHAVPPLANTSGFPNAFPRPNSKKLFENDKVVVWDYTWTTGVPTPMHFHDKDVVVVYLETGGLKSTTAEGQSVVNDLQPGLIRFNARDRVHTEELVRGKSRAIITELK
jgi:hypothetical protein